MTLLALGSGTLLGCASIFDLAPPVSDELMRTGAAAGAPRESLERGRRLYVEDCTRCHAPVAVGKYSRDQWDAILPRMAKTTRLDADETADLQVYIRAVVDENSP